MDDIWKAIVERQFGASIDMLENALRACPADLWGDRSQHVEFWYVIYHTLFWLDLYLTGSVDGFAPPAPYTLDELDPTGVFPTRVYEQSELLVYLAHCRHKAHQTIEVLTDEQARRRCAFSWGELSFEELLLDNMRHVQYHAAELNLLLGQTTGSAPGWVSGARPRPSGD